MQDGGQRPACALVGEVDFLLLRQPVGEGKLKLKHLMEGDDRRRIHVERLGVVDIFLVQRIPEMIMRCRDDLVESGRTVVVAINLHHCREVVRCDGIIGGVFGDMRHINPSSMAAFGYCRAMNNPSAAPHGRLAFTMNVGQERQYPNLNQCFV